MQRPVIGSFGGEARNTGVKSVDSSTGRADVDSTVLGSETAGGSGEVSMINKLKGALAGGLFGAGVTGIPLSLGAVAIKSLMAGTLLSIGGGILAGAGAVATGVVSAYALAMSAMITDSPRAAEAFDKGMNAGMKLGIPTALGAVAVGAAAGGGPLVLVPLGLTAYAAAVTGTVGKELAKINY
jgi:hypothetical protein